MRMLIHKVYSSIIRTSYVFTCVILLWDMSSPNVQLLVKVTDEGHQTFMYPYTDLLCKPQAT